MDTLTIISIIIGAVSIIVAILWPKINELKKENKELKEDNKKLKEKIKELEQKSLDAHPSTKPRNPANDSQLIRLAKNWESVSEVRIIGINAIGVVHRAYEDIKECLEKGKRVKILLLNPYSKEFLQRIDVECKWKGRNEDYESHRQRLLAEWNATYNILYNIAKNVKNKDLLEVRLRDEKPEYAFTATISEKDDECFALINKYPDGGRGISGEQHRCWKADPGEKEGYEKYINKFEESWDKAKTLFL